jgi:predicted metal-binding membrane protein
MEHEMSDGLSDYRRAAALPAGSALVAILLGLAGGAWLISARLATPDMRMGVLTGAAMMSARSPMGMPSSMSMGLSAFIAIWTVMMVAMMVPSLVPAVRTFDTWAHSTGLSGGATVLFVTWYLLVWSAIGAVAYLIVQALQGWLPAGSMAALRVGAALLVVAGVYQLTPPKQACLRRCRSPHVGVAPPVGTRVQGHPGAVYAGLGQGLYCLGSSWPLMLVLLLVGLMNRTAHAAGAGRSLSGGRYGPIPNSRPGFTLSPARPPGQSPVRRSGRWASPDQLAALQGVDFFPARASSWQRNRCTMTELGNVRLGHAPRTSAAAPT